MSNPMTTEQHGSKTEGRVAEINAAIKQIMDGAVDALTNEEYIAIHNLQTERSRLQSVTPSPQSPPEPGRGDDLARQERMAELRTNIENWHRVIGRFGSSSRPEREELARYEAELSRLRNEGGRPKLRLEEDAQGKRAMLGGYQMPDELIPSLEASPSDLLAREAIERAAENLGVAWSAVQNEPRIEIRSWGSEANEIWGKFHRAVGDVLIAIHAALQPLSQGNGEAVAWQYRVKLPNGERSEWIDLPEAGRYWTDKHAEFYETRPLYAAPSSQPEGVRRALEATRKALEEIADFRGTCLMRPSLGADYDRAYQEGSNRAFEQAADAAVLALGSLPHDATTPSPGLVEAAEWHEEQAKHWAGRYNEATGFKEQVRCNLHHSFHFNSAKHFRTLSAKPTANCG
jgi:hypothetical protein